MRSEYSDSISTLDEGSRQIPNEGSCSVAFEARIGLGQKEKIQGRPSLLHSLLD